MDKYNIKQLSIFVAVVLVFTYCITMLFNAWKAPKLVNMCTDISVENQTIAVYDNKNKLMTVDSVEQMICNNHTKYCVPEGKWYYSITNHRNRKTCSSLMQEYLDNINAND